MTLQTSAVLIVVAFAIVYLTWRGWRTFRPNSSGCGGSCACPSAAVPREQTLSLSTSRLEKKA
ncbi:MAG: hypothetical protein K2X38_04505 [Gemmataceae bacterium]|nr:hypothetical protein [Gemmataceae bacterium]